MATKDISQLPALILGGATFNTQYNDDPHAIPVADMLRYAFSNGITAIDTSPYYGPSELIYGAALHELRDEWPRDTYFICTKVGRVRLDEFDYSRAAVRASVLRSCERLHTRYLDMLYLHDIEFVADAQIWEALAEMRRLKDEGVVRNIGVSGYPVDFLYRIARGARARADVGPLDNVLSYCNLNLQNRTLEQYYERFVGECGLKTLCNGSILSMSLLTAGETRSFHPCSEELRERSARAARYLREQGVDLADLATKYALDRWRARGPTVLGCSNVREVEHALKNYREVLQNEGLTTREQALVDHVQRAIFGELLDSTWPSGRF